MQKILKLDKKVSFFMIEHYHNHFVNGFFKIISSSGDFGLVWIAMSIILMNFERTEQVGQDVLVAIFVTTLIGQLTIKSIVKRKRPCHIYPDERMLISIPVDYSFPSGHTSCSFACSIIIMELNVYVGVFCLLFSAVMGISRIFLFVHYLSDVVCGALLGTTIGIILLMVL